MNVLQEYDCTDLLEKARNGDRDARSAMVEKNIGLVWSIVRRFTNRGYESDDLFQIGCIGLIKAVNKFDPSFNVRFSTYAVPMIIGEIKRFIRDDGIIKVSRSLKEISGKARMLRDQLCRENGRDPTVSDMADKLGVSKEDLVMAMDSSNIPESLYSTIGEGDSVPVYLIDRVNDCSNMNESELIDRIALRQILEKLAPRERKIIMLRFFMEKTQVQIAKQLGISQVQVSRIEKRILEDIRKEIQAK